MSKMYQQIRNKGGHLVFLINPRNTNLVEDIEILLPVKFPRIPFSGSRGEVENVSVNQKPGGHPDFPIDPKKTNFIEDTEILLPVKFRWNLWSSFKDEVVEFRSAVSEENSKMSQPIKGKGGHFVFPIGQKKKQKIGRGHWDFASCQVSLNSV